MEPKLEPKLALVGTSFTYFHPWVFKAAQVVPDVIQRCLKGAQRPLKWSQNGAQGLQNMIFQWGGFPLSYIYIYIHICMWGRVGFRTWVYILKHNLDALMHELAELAMAMPISASRELQLIWSPADRYPHLERDA